MYNEIIMNLDLTETFNAFAARAVADFPELAGKFSIYSAPTETLHGSFADEEVPRLLYMQKGQVSDFLSKNYTRPHGFATEAEGFSLINYIAEEQDRRNYIVDGGSYLREVVAAMEHELAHLVAPGALAKGPSLQGSAFKECVAEAFTFIRQAQQFGEIDDQVARDAHIQASHMILSQDRTHFAVPVINQVARIATTHDLSALTPRETANLAFRLALQHAASSADLYKVAAAYRPVMLAYGDAKTRWKPAMFEACAEVLLKEHDEAGALIFETGRAFLEPFVNGRMDMILAADLFAADELKAMFKGPLWDRVREKIAGEDARPVDRFRQEARDLAALGYFDRSPDDMKYPAPYASGDNQARLGRAQDIYAAALRLEETGMLDGSGDVEISSSDVEGLDRDGLIELARRMTYEPPVRSARAPGSPAKTTLKI